MDEDSLQRHAEAEAELLAANQVTVALSDGSKLVGRLVRFSPKLADLRLEVSQACEGYEPFEVARVPADEVIYVAAESRAKHAPATPKAAQWRLRVIGGGEWLVEADPKDISDPRGFFARALNDAKFSRMYFYRHGIYSRERDAPLGALLVAAGVLDRADLQRGVKVQAQGRSMPIGQILVEQKRLDAGTVDEAAELQKRKQVRIGEVLQEAGLISAKDLEQALAEQTRRKGRRIGEILVGLGVLSERDLTLTLAMKFDMPFVNLEQAQPEPQALAAAGRAFIEEYRVLPLAIDETTLTLAVTDPTLIEPLAELRQKTARRIYDVLVTPSQLNRQIDLYLRSELRTSRDPPMPIASVAAAPTDPPRGIDQLIAELLASAKRAGASDIHIEPNGKEQSISVRLRVHGKCVAHARVPPILRRVLVARFKAMAQLDADTHQRPQSGMAHHRELGASTQLCVTTYPTAQGDEDVHLRLREGARPIALDALGLSAHTLNLLRRALSTPRGLWLCAGPEGSGVTSTLHALLGALMRPDLKVATAEHPIELVSQGARQIPVHREAGFDFAAAAKLLLKTDVDVMLLGEVADSATALHAMEGVLRGRHVLGGINAKSALDALARLSCMGLQPGCVGDAPIHVLAQRLVGALCPSCAFREPMARADYDELVHLYGPELFEKDLGIAYSEKLELVRTPGCKACDHTGYAGRIALFELLSVDGELRSALANKAPPDAIRALSSAAGARSLFQDGVRKVLAGQTDLDQLRRTL